MKATKRKDKLIVLFFSILAALLAKLSMSLYGPGLSYDSTEYIRLARDISANGFAFLGEYKAISQPPLYPLVLVAISKLLGVSIVKSAEVLNVLASGSIAASTLLAVSRVTPSSYILFLTGVLSCFSIPLTHVWSMAWTEPLFILTICLIALALTSNMPQNRTVLLTAFLTIIACMTRYAGVVLVPVVTLYLFFIYGGNYWTRSRNVFLYVAPVALMLLSYASRNYILSGTLFGHRVPSNFSLDYNIVAALYVVFSWLFPWCLKSMTTFLTSGSITVGAAISMWSQRSGILAEFKNNNRILSFCALFVIAYVSFIIWTSTTTAYDHIDTRLLSPVYPFLLILFVAILRREIWKTHWLSISVFSLFVFTSVSGSIISTIMTIGLKIDDGAGEYNTRRWRESETLRFIEKRDFFRTEKIYSNVPDVLYVLADIDSKLSPRHSFKDNSDTKTGITTENIFERIPSFDGSLLVWFDDDRRAFLFTPNDLKENSNLETVANFSDGAIYRVHSQN